MLLQLFQTSPFTLPQAAPPPLPQASPYHCPCQWIMNMFFGYSVSYAVLYIPMTIP